MCKRRQAVVQRLMAAEADPNVQDRLGLSALMVAAISANPSHGPNPNPIPDPDPDPDPDPNPNPNPNPNPSPSPNPNPNPNQVAAISGEAECVRVLMQGGAASP